MGEEIPRGLVQSASERLRREAEQLQAIAQRLTDEANKILKKAKELENQISRRK